MLKLQSAFLGLVVCIPTSPLLSSAVCRADGENLPDAGRLQYELPVGSEKACGDDLPGHGVSFPTQLYTNHLTAYHRKVVFVTTVDAGRLKSGAVSGRMKASATPDQPAEDNRLVAELFPFESLPPAFAASPAAEVSTAATDAAADRPVTQKPTELAENLPSEESAGRWRAAQPQKRVTSISEFAPAAPLTRPDLQTVAFQKVDDTPVLEPPTMATEGGIGSRRDLQARLNSDAEELLFASMDSIRLNQSIRSETELPDPANPGRDHFEKAGSQHHWKAGNWVSVRPKRNTYPFQHNPLYFEDPNLERCGRSCGYLTELASVAHFAGRIPVLPYMMTVEPPCSLVDGKPDCPSCHKFGADAYFPRPDEVDLGGSAVQAAVVVGLIFLIP